MARHTTWGLSLVALVAMSLGGCGATQHNAQTAEPGASPPLVAVADEAQTTPEGAAALEPWTVPQQVATAPEAPAPDAVKPPEAPAEMASSAAADESAAEPGDLEQRPAVASVESEDNMLLVRRLVVARGIEDREPVETAVTFDSASEPLFAFLELANQQEESQNVVVSFEREDGTKVRSISLEVPARVTRWRTWARCYGIDQQGSWNVVARTPDGQLLAQGAFNVAAATEQDTIAP